MKALFYVALFIFTCLTSLLAQKPIDLTHHIESSYIGKHISYFEDKEGTYSIESIASLPNQLFTTYNNDIVNLGYSRFTYWLKLVVNGQDSFSDWVLEIRFPILDSVTLYYKNESGIWKEKNDGDNWPFLKRDINSRNIAFKLPPANGGAAVYYLKIKSTDAIIVPVKIEKKDFFVSESLKSEVFYGICYGIMLVMLFYNLFIYFSTWDKSYIYYVLQVTSAILFYGFWYGHIPQYITHFRSPILNYFPPIIICPWIIAIILFVKSFLNLSKVSLFLNRLLNVFFLFTLLSGLFALVNIGPLSTGLFSLLSPLTAIAFLITGIVSMKKGNREARFFVLAWGLFLFTVIIMTLSTAAIIPAYGFIENILIIGNVAEITLSSFALADKINIYRRQKEQAQEQIIHLREEDATLLEQKVKERTAQLQRANEEINLANKDLEAFSHSASHDLRAPLRSITNFTKVLEKKSGDVLGEESKHYLSIIQNSAKSMDQLIEDLLAFSRLGKKELLKEGIKMKDLVETVVTDLKSNLKPEQIINIKMGVIDNSIGDPVLLKQVWANLISNAIKFSTKKPKSEIEIGSTTSDTEVTYWVKDNGVGFNMNNADKLFQAFQRLHSQTEFEGTGLGLSIVKRIVVGHGGRVWAESIEGEGATFYFSLPK